MPLVYLSGPIAHTTYEGATSWYGEVRRKLAPGIRTLEPMRGKEYLALHEGIIGKFPTMPDHPMARIIATAQAITGRDRYDTQRADAVLMNLTAAPEVSIGCMIEAGWADAARVPIILCMQPGNVHEGHPILETLATYRVTNLEDACHCINILFAQEVKSALSADPGSRA